MQAIDGAHRANAEPASASTRRRAAAVICPPNRSAQTRKAPPEAGPRHYASSSTGMGPGGLAELNGLWPNVAAEDLNAETSQM